MNQHLFKSFFPVSESTEPGRNTPIFRGVWGPRDGYLTKPRPRLQPRLPHLPVPRRCHRPRLPPIKAPRDPREMGMGERGAPRRERLSPRERLTSRPLSDRTRTDCAPKYLSKSSFSSAVSSAGRCLTRRVRSPRGGDSEAELGHPLAAGSGCSGAAMGPGEGPTGTRSGPPQ